jgi:intracellular multiplication protein IcmO
MGLRREVSGPDEKYKIGNKRLVKDVRPLLEKVQDSLTEDKNVLMTIFLGTGIVPFVVPLAAIPMFLTAIIIFMIIYPAIHKDCLPLRLPLFSKKLDYNDPKPGSRKPNMASGAVFLGNELSTNKELWVSIRDAVTHFMIFGSTGSGKTELIMGLAAGSLYMCSGFSLTDPKGSKKVALQGYSLCRFFLREHDFRVLDYSGSTSALSGRNAKKETNTTNPVFRGTDMDATNTLTSLITVAKGDNAVFGAQAQNFMTNLIRALVELRDKHRKPLDIRTIRQFTPSYKMIELSESPLLSETTKDGIRAYLSSVGYSPKVDASKQPSSFNQQYGYSLAYFSQVLNSLADSYSYIYGTTRGEVDRIDCIRERRILIEIIPSLKKSPAEVSNIGKISLSSIKMAIGMGLGDQLEGIGKEILAASPMSGRESAPYMIIIDEMAAIATEGFVTVLTQGRSIGVCAVIASQDADGLKKASEQEFGQSTENSKIKIFGVMDLKGGTYDLLEKVAGKVKVYKTQGSQMKPDAAVSGYYDEGRAAVDEMDRVSSQEMQQQIEGEWIVGFRGRVVRMVGFFVDPQIKNMTMRINRFITNPNVYEEDVAEFKQGVGAAIDALMDAPEGGYSAVQDGMHKSAIMLNNILSEAGMNKTGLGMREQSAGAFLILKMLVDKVDGSGGQKNKQKVTEVDGLIAKRIRENNVTAEDMETTQAALIKELLGEEDERFKSGTSVKEAIRDSITEEIDASYGDIDAILGEGKHGSYRDHVRKEIGNNLDDYDIDPDPPAISESTKMSLQEKLKRRVKGKGQDNKI